MNPVQPKKNYIFYLYLIAIYSAISCCCYLVGYWGTFGINIFSYASIQEILTSAFPYFIFYLFIFTPYIYQHTTLFPKEFTNSTPGFIPFLISVLLFSAYIIIILIKYGTYSKLENCTIACAIVFFILVAMHRHRTIIINKFKINQITPLLLTIIFPFWLYYVGTVAAFCTMYDLDYDEINQNFNKKLYSNLSLNPPEKITYLGKNGDFIFLLLKDKSVAIINYEDIDHLVFNHNKPSSFFNYISRSFTLLTKQQQSNQSHN